MSGPRVVSVPYITEDDESFLLYLYTSACIQSESRASVLQSDLAGEIPSNMQQRMQMFVQWYCGFGCTFKHPRMPMISSKTILYHLFVKPTDNVDLPNAEHSTWSVLIPRVVLDQTLTLLGYLPIPEVELEAPQREQPPRDGLHIVCCAFADAASHQDSLLFVFGANESV